MSNINSNSEKIKLFAKELGFYACGIAKPRNLSMQHDFYLQWLKENQHGEMHYLENYIDIRLNPIHLLENCKSVIVCAMNYYPSQLQNKDNKIQFSKYAYADDYHNVINSKFNILVDKIREFQADFSYKICVDTKPIFEKAWAVEAGLGWIGKNSLLIIPKAGSFFFIGILLVDFELDYDKNFDKNYCGNCNKCVEACPSMAINVNCSINAAKCLSYKTIEQKILTDNVYNNSKVKYFYGCDICQDVCPWNIKFAKPNNELIVNTEILNYTDRDWLGLTKEKFSKVLKNSVIKRIKFEKWRFLLDFIYKK